MPDGDEIHSGLTRPFQDLYAQLCEGHWETDTLVEKACQSLSNQIARYGDAPVLLGHNLATLLEQINNASHNHAEVCDQIDFVSRSGEFNISPRGRDLMVSAGKSLLFDLQNGALINDIGEALCRRYCVNIYEQDFDLRVQQQENHFKNADRQDVEERKAAIKPHVLRKCEKFSQKMAENQTSQKLYQRKATQKPITVEDAAW